MAKEVDRKSAHRGLAGFGKLPPGAVMAMLWFIGMMLFFSLAMSFHVVASVLAELYAAG